MDSPATLIDTVCSSSPPFPQSVAGHSCEEGGKVTLFTKPASNRGKYAASSQRGTPIARQTLPVIPVQRTIRPTSPPFLVCAGVGPSAPIVFDFSVIPYPRLATRRIILPCLKTIYDPMDKIRAKLATREDSLKLLTNVVKQVPRTQQTNPESGSPHEQTLREGRSEKDLHHSDGNNETMQSEPNMVKECSLNAANITEPKLEAGPTILAVEPSSDVIKPKKRPARSKVNPKAEIRRMSRRASELCAQRSGAPIISYEMVDEQDTGHPRQRTCAVVGSMMPLGDSQIIRKSFHKLHITQNLEGVI